MKSITKDNFFERKHNIAVPIILFAGIVILLICVKVRFVFGVEIGGVATLVASVILVTNASKGSQSKESLKLLKDMGLYEQMKKEFPEETARRIYHVSSDFVYGFSWRVCIPLKMIVEIKTDFVHYINGGGKDRECVILELSNGERYKLFNYYGFDTGHKSEIQQCLVEILQHNPSIIINGKSVV